MLMNQATGMDISSTTAIQHCGEEISSGSVVGVISSSGDGVSALRKVQEAIVRWDQGDCVSDLGESPKLNTTSPWMKQVDHSSNSTNGLSPELHNRATSACRGMRVISNDHSCSDVAKRCGHGSLDRFYAYNPGINLQPHP
jgi:hypothetical protein